MKPRSRERHPIVPTSFATSLGRDGTIAIPGAGQCFRIVKDFKLVPRANPQDVTWDEPRCGDPHRIDACVVSVKAAHVPRGALNEEMAVNRLNRRRVNDDLAQAMPPDQHLGRAKKDAFAITDRSQFSEHFLNPQVST